MSLTSPFIGRDFGGVRGDVSAAPPFPGCRLLTEDFEAAHPANESPMKNIPRSTSTTAGKARNVLCVLVGTAALVLKKYYDGPGERLVHNYGGNIAASFAVYFVLLQLPIPTVLKKPVSAGLALALVELFEAFDGFGVMLNTYDPFDFVANALGVGLALIVDTTLRFRGRAPLTRDGVRGD